MFKSKNQINRLLLEVESLGKRVKSLEAQASADGMVVALTRARKKGKDTQTEVIMLAGRKKGMTVRDLAERLDCDRAWARHQTLSFVESGLIAATDVRFTPGMRGKPPTVYTLK